MSVFLKGNFRASPMYAVDNNNRNCDLEFITPSENDFQLSDILWTRSRGCASGPLADPCNFQAMETVWYNWPRRESGARSCYLISGTTRNAAGAALANCIVKCFTSADDTEQESCVSRGGGDFDCPTYKSGNHYLVAYKAGSPDVAGTTRNNLTPS